MNKKYHTKNNQTSFEKALEISKREGWNLNYLNAERKWIVYYNYEDNNSNYFSDLNYPENSVPLNYNDFFAVVAASLVKGKPVLENVTYYTNNSPENYQKALDVIEDGVECDYCSYHRYLMTDGKELQSGDYMGGFKYLEPEEFFNMIKSNLTKVIYTKFDERIGAYFDFETDYPYASLQLLQNGEVKISNNTENLISHSDFIAEWTKRNKKKDKTLDFKIYGFNPVLTEKEIKIGCQTISREIFEKVAAAIENPVFENKGEYFYTDYSKEFFNYLKTLPQNRNFSSSLAREIIYLNEGAWGHSYLLANYDKITHSEFLQKFSEPSSRKVKVFTYGKNSIKIYDEGIIYIKNNGLSDEIYKISFEEFEQLNKAAKEFYGRV